MSYWVITANGTAVSRTIVSRVTNIEVKTDENKARVTALDKKIQKSLNDEAHFIVQGGNNEPDYWIVHPFYIDPDFQEEFSHVVSNDKVAESGDDLSLNVFDDTYLSMEFALPNRG